MIREFFYLQKSDRKVILSLLVVIVSVFTMICLTGGNDTSTTTTQKNSPRSAARKNHYYATSPKKVERFTFDPNTADSTQLLRLGLQPWQVRNIYKYRAAGGIYRQPIDFAKLYGLTVKATEHIVLNTADSTALTTIPGIGPYYARRIIQYGNRLGGYVSVEQLDEIDDFPTEAKQYLVINNPAPKKLNINQLSLNELRRHPYINFYMAKAITDYRRLHGTITSLNELRLIKDFTPEVIKRLTPYVAY